VSPAGHLVYRQQTLSDEVKAELFINQFLNSTSSEVRLSSLTGLFGLRGFEDEPLDLFFNLDADQQSDLFEGLSNPQQIGQDALLVVTGLYQNQHLKNNIEQNRLLRAMASVLHQVEGEEVPGAKIRALEINYWVAGREQALKEDFVAAIKEYNLALGLNEDNPPFSLTRGWPTLH
jgi:hypothetical protein